MQMPPSKQTSPKSLVSDARPVLDRWGGVAARLVARRITRFLETQMQGAGMSLAQFMLMAHIASARDDTIGALAAQTEHDQSTLSRNLRGLERAGLVEITVAPEDQRRRAVWLTEKGARRLEAAIPIWRQAQQALAEAIDTGAVRDLAAVTGAIAEPTRPRRVSGARRDAA